MKYLIKPLTKKMLVQLRAARSIELAKTGRNICLPDDYKGSLAGLYRRGFVNTQKKVFNGKEIVSVYITQPGINFLEKYEDEKIKIKPEYNILR
jgi:hypothetical protein